MTSPKVLDSVIKSRRTMIARLQVELAELEALRGVVVSDPNQTVIPGTAVPSTGKGAK